MLLIDHVIRYFRAFPNYRQLEDIDCGPTCLKIISRHYGRNIPIEYLRAKCEVSRDGVTLSNLRNAAESIGFTTLLAHLDLKNLTTVPLPFIAYWQRKHFVVVYDIDEKNVWISDPAFGRAKHTIREFNAGWSQGSIIGTILGLEPTPAFYAQHRQKETQSGLRYVLNHADRYKGLCALLVFGCLIASTISMAAPLLLEFTVDNAIPKKDVSLLKLIFVSQIAILVFRVFVNFWNNRIAYKISAKLYSSIYSCFLTAIERSAPRSFESFRFWDLHQKIEDLHRVDRVISVPTISTAFSMVSLVGFLILLGRFPLNIFALVGTTTLTYVAWNQFFVNSKKKKEFERATLFAKHHLVLSQYIKGARDIKLYRSEAFKRKQLYFLEKKLETANKEYSSLNGNQEIGSTAIIDIKNISISLVAVLGVINGDITIGQMVAIQYIAIHLSTPLQQLIPFIQFIKSSSPSFGRLSAAAIQDGEVNQISKRSDSNQNYISSIELVGVSFRYPGSESPLFENLNFAASARKITAVIGGTGTGKTTLVKLLLGLLEPSQGTFLCNNEDISKNYLNANSIQAGFVFQDSSIYFDSIANNITMAQKTDRQRLNQVSRVVGIESFIDSLPFGYETTIGDDHDILEHTRIQQILIARAIYLAPAFLLFDETFERIDVEVVYQILTNIRSFCPDCAIIVTTKNNVIEKIADATFYLDAKD